MNPSNGPCPGCGSKQVSILHFLPTESIICGYWRENYVKGISRLFDYRSRYILLARCHRCDLKWFVGSPAADSSFYEELQKFDWYYRAQKPEYDFAVKHIPAGSSVLEVGCGQGFFSSYLSDCQYRGLEFNLKAVKHAQDKGLDVRMKSLDEEVNERPGSYDIVCHFQVLEHVPEPLSFMKSCVKLLRPGGRMIVAVPSDDSFLGLAENAWLNLPPHHLTRWTDRALESIFCNAGVSPIEIWHEPVADYEKEWHQQIVEKAGLMALYGAYPSPIATRWGNLANRILARLPRSVRHVCFRHGIRMYPMAMRGHTVCVIGYKS